MAIAPPLFLFPLGDLTVVIVGYSGDGKDLEWPPWAQVHCHVLLESSGARKPQQSSALQCLLKGHSSTWEMGAVGLWGRDLWPLKATGDSHGQSHMSKMKTFGFCQWLRSSRLHQVWGVCVRSGAEEGLGLTGLWLWLCVTTNPEAFRLRPQRPGLSLQQGLVLLRSCKQTVVVRKKQHFLFHSSMDMKENLKSTNSTANLPLPKSPVLRSWFLKWTVCSCWAFGWL